MLHEYTTNPTAMRNHDGELQDLQIGRKWIEAWVNQIAQVIYSVAKHVDWDTALSKRYQSSEYALSDEASLLSQITTLQYWKQQLLLAIHGLDNEEGGFPRLVQFKSAVESDSSDEQHKPLVLKRNY